MEYVLQHLRRSEEKVNESKYMNEMIIVEYIYTWEETGGEWRSEL